ncbi:winged helix-turn-helix domain-containing protein [Alkalidesulfovibrio alkalitolerans]|uniref:winged helix-turn-helix domain-containing protein n=1 Tax=Alkalidesulfovibrio alkalitolerans TaxID=293256 RepID=UPI00191C1311|nr:winged helix-turn-helix domain-containing protein [Alkalidesulfovibrio alkalitolerans]
MAFPGVQDITLPLLRYLGDGEIRSNAEIYAEMAKHFSLSEDDLRVLLPSGRQPIFKNRVAWAKAFLKQARILESPARGNYVITKRGKEVLAENVQRLTNKYLCRFDEFVEFKRVGRMEICNLRVRGKARRPPLNSLRKDF